MKYSAYTWSCIWLLLAPLGLMGQVPRFERVVEYGSPYTSGQAAMVLDSDDNLYVAGTFKTLVCFQDTCLQSVTNQNTVGFQDDDMYLISFDPLGQLRWARVFDGNNRSWARGMEIVDGRLHLTGYFSKTLPIGSDTLTTQISSIFYLGIGLDGTIEQSAQIDGNDQEETQSMTVDQEGGVWIGGFTDSDSIRSTGGAWARDTLGFRDLFVANLTPGGTTDQIWVWESTTDGWGGRLRHLKVDSNGYVYAEGAFEGNLIIGSDTLWSTTNTWNRLDNFLVKLSPQGELIWARVGVPISDMALHHQDQLVITGNTNQRMTWGNSTLEAGYFLVALGADGEPEWVSQSPGFDPFRISSMAIKQDRIYTYLWHGGPATFPDTSYFVEDKVMILRHNTQNGRLIWHKEFGEEDVQEYPGGLLVTSNYSLISAGRFITHLQNYTYLDSIQVVDQYPFSSAYWNYIGFTSPDSSLSTTILQTDSSREWVAYPNPVQDIVNVGGMASHQLTDLQLFDVRGRCMLAKHILVSVNSVRLDLRGLEPGVYFLKASQPGYFQIFRIIKQP